MWCFVSVYLTESRKPRPLSLRIEQFFFCTFIYSIAIPELTMSLAHIQIS